MEQNYYLCNFVIMKKYIFTSIFFCAAIIASQTTLFAQNTDTEWKQKVDASVLSEAQNTAKADFLLILKRQADVSAAEKLNTKDEKAWFVFNTLKQHAELSQREIIAVLKNENVTYQSFFVVNALRIQANSNLLERLAKRTDVEKITSNTPIFFGGAHSSSSTHQSASERNNIEWGVAKIQADSVWAMGFRGQGVTVGGEDTGYAWEVAPIKKKYRGYNAADSSVNHNYNWHDAIHAIDPHYIQQVVRYDTLMSQSGMLDSLVVRDTLYVASQNPCGLSILAPCDDNNHGTHTMGTMVGDDGEGNQIGIAPEARWVGCRNMERGWGMPSTYIEAFEWFIAPTDLNGANPNPSKSPHAINNSWGCPADEGCNPSNYSVMAQVVTNVKAAGIVPVVSAGNSGSNCNSINNPAAIFENSFSVGATDINDTIAGFSSRGPVTVDGSGRLKPNVTAPGVGVRSVIKDGSFATWNGTSMAGPHVVGAVALMISANPSLAGQVAIIERILQETATPLTTTQECGGIAGSQIPNPVYGFGRINALAAVKKALVTIVGIEENKELEGKITAYPNPTSGLFSLAFEQMYGSTTIQIFSASGQYLQREVRDLQGNNIIDISLKNYPSGVYYYKIYNKNQVKQGKIVKQ